MMTMLQPLPNDDDDDPITGVHRVAIDRTHRGVDAARLVQTAWLAWRDDRQEEARQVTLEAVEVWMTSPQGVDEEDLIALVDEACGRGARAIVETIRHAAGLAAFASAR